MNTETKQGHTPTPWVISPPTCRLLPWEIVAADGARLARTAPDGDEAANAAHIVRCVNAHERLVDALETIVRAHEADPYDGVTYREIDTARAALAAARGEES